MSKNDIYSQRPIESTYYPKNIFIPYNPNLNYLDNQPEFNYSQPLPDFNDIINRQKRNKVLYQTSPEYESNYINERYSKVKQENADLKMKLFELERDYKIKKGEIEEQVLILRDENSSLQLQIQKIIEKQKEENNISNNIHNENIALINDLNLLHNDSLILKDDITRKVADIEEKNKIINDLRIEKTILVNDQKSMKIQIESLNNDKEVLLKQIKDLNETIGEKISPKLKENEVSLAKLQEQAENLRVENEKLKSDNLLLFNENNIQKNLIQILTKQNKKLLGEIKEIYDRDILLMDNMEKMGSDSTNKYKNIFNNKKTIENDNLFEEEMNILKDSQKYLDENNEIQNFNNNEIFMENDNININNDKKDLIKNQIKSNKNKREINSIINNDIVVKRNKESVDIEQNIIRKIKNNKLFNNSINGDINNEKISKQKMNISNSYSNKNTETNVKKNKLKNRNYNFNSQSFTEGNNLTQNKFTEMDEDIKIENKTLNQEGKHKILKINNDFNIDDEKTNFLYNTDGRMYIKSKKNEMFDKLDNKEYNNDKNNYEEKEFDKNINFTNSNNFDLYNANNINTNENNNLLVNSQNKSQLSEYVEDLDVIQYK